MSEYQYYEFLAVDTPLTEKQIQQVRRYSSRAQITPTSFVNVYNWGDFRGDVRDFLKRFFDLHLYVTNWGTHDFAFRAPAELIDLRALKRYETEESLVVQAASEHVFLYFSSQSEDYDDMDDGSGWMASLAPLREEVVSGDYRPLYLAWLAGVQWSEPDDNASEPPVPAGLQELSAAQQALVDFMRLDEDLLKVTAEASQALTANRSGLAEWIAGLPESEKNDILGAICGGSDPGAAVRLRRRFNASQTASRGQAFAQPARTVGALVSAARQIAERRKEQEAQRKAAEKARREAQAAKARAEYLAELAKREPAAWRQIEELIAMKQPKRYDEAVVLLRDLADLAMQSGKQTQFAARITDLKDRHANRPALLQRLTKAGLVDRQNARSLRDSDE